MVSFKINNVLTPWKFQMESVVITVIISQAISPLGVYPPDVPGQIQNHICESLYIITVLLTAQDWK